MRGFWILDSRFWIGRWRALFKGRVASKLNADATGYNCPFDEARAVYADGKSPRSFEHDLVLHLEHGFVFSTPAYFVMGRPVKSSAPEYAILNPCVNWPRAECDCWHVYLCAGDIKRAFGVMPWPLPCVSYERDGKLRFLTMEQVIRTTEMANERTQNHG